MISFGPTEEQELVRETMREFAADVLRPAAREADEASALPDGLLEQAWELGLTATQIPRRTAAAARRARRSRTRSCSRSSAAATRRSALAATQPVAVRLRGCRPRHGGAEAALLPLFCGDALPRRRRWRWSSRRRCSTPRALRTTAEPKGGALRAHRHEALRAARRPRRATSWWSRATRRAPRAASARSTPSSCRATRQGLSVGEAEKNLGLRGRAHARASSSSASRCPPPTGSAATPACDARRLLDDVAHRRRGAAASASRAR